MAIKVVVGNDNVSPLFGINRANALRLMWLMGAVSVLLRMTRARRTHNLRSDNVAARRLERSASCRIPRHRVKGEALVREFGIRIGIDASVCMISVEIFC